MTKVEEIAKKMEEKAKKWFKNKYKKSSADFRAYNLALEEKMGILEDLASDACRVKKEEINNPKLREDLPEHINSIVLFEAEVADDDYIIPFNSLWEYEKDLDRRIEDEIERRLYDMEGEDEAQYDILSYCFPTETVCQRHKRIEEGCIWLTIERILFVDAVYMVTRVPSEDLSEKRVTRLAILE